MNLCDTWSFSCLNFAWFSGAVYYVSEYVFVFVSVRVFTHNNKLSILILLFA